MKILSNMFCPGMVDTKSACFLWPMAFFPRSATTSLSLRSIRLSYGRMVWMALPYSVTIILGGLLAGYVLLQPVTETYYAQGVLTHHVAAVAAFHSAQGIPAFIYVWFTLLQGSLGCVYLLPLPHACRLPDFHNAILPAMYFRM